MKDCMNAMGWTPRWVLWGLAGLAVGLLAFGLMLQVVMGLEPCPMCIVQRYALVLIALVAGAGGVSSRTRVQGVSLGAVALLAGLGGFVAARQSWLQWYPPEVVSCGRDFYGMIETFPLKRALPMIFRGGGDCTKVDWTFLGGSIANWSFVCFMGMLFMALFMLYRSTRKH
jgi:protein dithiol:quinone oxidoreductase